MSPGIIVIINLRSVIGLVLVRQTAIRLLVYALSDAQWRAACKMDGRVRSHDWQRMARATPVLCYMQPLGGHVGRWDTDVW